MNTSMQTKPDNKSKKAGFKAFIFLGNAGIFIITLGVFLLLTFSTENFFSAYNLFVISRTFSLMVIVGFAQLMVIVVGDMNLSVGAIGGLAGITTGYLLDTAGSPIWLAIIAGILIGIIAGAINGFLITKTGINAFVITLATTSLYSGIVLGVTKGYPYMKLPRIFKTIGKGDIFGIPYLLFIMLSITVILHILFRYSSIGRKILATGGNRIAAKLSGIKVTNISLLVHILSGMLAGIAGVLFVSRIGSAQPTIGQDWLLMSFAIPVIGGTSMAGGNTSAFGALLGGILMVIIKNGLVILNVNIYWQEFFLGLLILMAVGIDRLRSIYMEKRQI